MKRVTYIKRSDRLKNYSIKEIAKLANVSSATVSRVINNSSYVEEEKRQRVIKVIQETNYIPNKVARSLFKHSSQIIGYIVPSITNPFFNELGRYIEQIAYQSNYHIILCNSNNNYEAELEYIRNLQAMNVDGLILTTTNTNLKYKTTMPVISIDRGFDYENNLVSIRSDHYTSGYLAAEHLYETGCKNMVFLGPFNTISTAKLRLQGYQAFCIENQLEARSLECGYEFEDGLKAMEILLKKYKNCDGIVCANDIVAIACYKILYNNNLKVPYDIKLIGYDNILSSEQVTPSLTTIEQPIEEIAKNAMKYMIDIIEKKEIVQKNIVLPVKLIKRETT
ncbi:hypothetical protein AN639_10550 [Candidatus Epulonipiscium fishelsonii]|uniref:Uncharacterized protein n=1 Tax=Candidatus Epulonipiscium fishelsonii TaxID=77094 RepID=A0ACC8XB62_9FIRM|nr:hypothetical protein AN396_06990 [Epulopiscium sp. SCG-B11WGA-EpuloA1]ONI43451.1 hypothetical protein AN639_10550 [Epulopiscium sp. SCG-B05WGA-EpuloA1]